MTLQLLLEELPKQEFVSEYFHTLPYSRPGSAAELCPLGTWETVGRILEQPADVMVVRRGEQRPSDASLRLPQARALSEDGYTILVRHAERHDSRLAELASSFAADFHAPVDIHLYVTPPGTHGFSWHYDAEDVFIIQTAGAKEYSLRKNTVNPWPLMETIPHNMRYERELMPLMKAELQAGDWLYIPCGYWHKADSLAGEEAAISLAVGVMSPAAIQIFDYLRTRLVDSILWRQRLPLTGDAADLKPDEFDAQLAEICQSLATDVSAALQNPHLPSVYRDWATRKFGGDQKE